jgi:proteasome accessory factor B
VLGLAEHPFGWSFDAIRDELRISEKTLIRYVRACRDQLVDWNDEPLLEIARRGNKRVLRFVERDATLGGTAYAVASLYFTLTLLRFLEGTVLKQGVEELWERVYRNLSARERLRLADFDRKFHAIPYAPKDYSAHDETLDLILRSLIGCHRLKIDYAGLLGEGKVHGFDPYTLVAYRGGLYLLGFSDVYDKVIYLAIERIRGIQRFKDADGALVRFAYPAGYRPELLTDGTFGLISGPETEVELRIRNATTEAHLRERQIHPTQRFGLGEDGRPTLTMTVRGTTELAIWILSMGPFVEVVRPHALRRRVAEQLSEAASLYREVMT